MVGCAHDGELIRASIDAPESFGALFDRHYGSIDAYCTRRLGSDGHDVSAATFVEAFRSRHRFETGRDDARPWLYGIASNLIRRHRRSESRRWRAYSRLPIAADGEHCSDARIDAAAAAPALARALHDINTRDRDALLLYAWADLTYEQIAEALAVPTGTVRSRIARARGRLRAALAHLDPTVDTRPGDRTLRGEP